MTFDFSFGAAAAAAAPAATATAADGAEPTAKEAALECTASLKASSYFERRQARLEEKGKKDPDCESDE